MVSNLHLDRAGLASTLVWCRREMGCSGKSRGKQDGLNFNKQKTDGLTDGSMDGSIYKRGISGRKKSAVTGSADCRCLGVVRIGPPHIISKVEVGMDQRHYMLKLLYGIRYILLGLMLVPNCHLVRN